MKRINSSAQLFKSMCRPVFLITLTVIAGSALLLVSSCSTKLSEAEMRELFCCQWGSENRPNFRKYAYTNDGVGLAYTLTQDTQAAAECRYFIVGMHQDHNGNIYYRVVENWDSIPYDDIGPSKHFVLFKLDAAQNILIRDGYRSERPGRFDPQTDTDEALWKGLTAEREKAEQKMNVFIRMVGN